MESLNRMQIYVHKDGQQHGPYTPEEIAARLRSGALMPDDLAWYEGCPEWMPVTNVAGSASPVPPPPPPSVSYVQSPAAAARFQHSGIFGCILLGIPAAAALMMWRSTEFGVPPAIISGAAVVATGFLAGIEAKLLGMGTQSDQTPKGKKRSGPGAWAAFIILLWAIGFPAYLYTRKRYGASNLLLPGILLVLLFFSIPFWPAPTTISMHGSAIESALDEFNGPNDDIITAAFVGQQSAAAPAGGSGAAIATIQSVTNIKRGDALEVRENPRIPAGTTLFPIKATLHLVPVGKDVSLESPTQQITAYFYKDAFGEWKVEAQNNP